MVGIDGMMGKSPMRVVSNYPKDWCENCERETGYCGWDIDEDEEDWGQTPESLVLLICSECQKTKKIIGMDFIQDISLLEEIVQVLGEIEDGDLSKQAAV